MCRQQQQQHQQQSLLSSSTTTTPSINPPTPNIKPNRETNKLSHFPRLSSAVLERFETAVLDMDEPGIAAACPLLAPLGLATQGQELYLGFARRALEAQLEAEAGDESGPAMQRLPAIYNVSAAFLRRCVFFFWEGGGG